MFKFLFGGKKSAPVVVIESDRAHFARLVTEMNELIDTLADKPRVTLDPATGHILPETPEQFADEALALPAPAPEPAPEVDVVETPEPDVADAPVTETSVEPVTDPVVEPVVEEETPAPPRKPDAA